MTSITSNKLKTKYLIKSKIKIKAYIKINVLWFKTKTVL